MDALKAPLADALRPGDLDSVVGQQHLLALDAPFRRALEAGSLGSFILWGPPGSGKTTLALLVSRKTSEHFVKFSAVTGGVQLVRQIVEEAAGRRASGTGTLLFVDEIHRFNRAQQDAFLPHVETGTIRLVGATTENPSFEINAPLLSRCAVYVLRALGKADLLLLLLRAAASAEFVERFGVAPTEGALELIASASDGDGRRALNILETVCGTLSGHAVELGREQAASILSRALLRYDKSGEEHYNLISALHKSLRSGDVDASLYWLARMLVSGEDPLYIARRLVRFASEDIGMADPSALTIAMRAADSYSFLGSPEGDLALAEAVCYMAVAPKSNSVYVAWGRASSVAQEEGSLPVPFHLRNAPTGLMQELGYSKGYQYSHDMPDQIVTSVNFPDEMGEPVFYEPGAAGRESSVAGRLQEWRLARRRAREGEKDGRDGQA
jgi:putative ATPase